MLPPMGKYSSSISVLRRSAPYDARSTSNDITSDATELPPALGRSRMRRPPSVSVTCSKPTTCCGRGRKHSTHFGAKINSKK